MIDELLDRLDKVRPTGKDRWMACCPVHGDKNPSMSVAEKDGRVLCHCFSCGANGLEVIKALGLAPSVLFEKPLGDGYIPKRVYEEAEIDRLVILGAEQMRAQGKRLTYKDFKRERLAKARLEVLEQRGLLPIDLNKRNKNVYL